MLTRTNEMPTVTEGSEWKMDSDVPEDETHSP